MDIKQKKVSLLVIEKQMALQPQTSAGAGGLRHLLNQWRERKEGGRALSPTMFPSFSPSTFVISLFKPE